MNMDFEQSMMDDDQNPQTESNPMAGGGWEHNALNNFEGEFGDQMAARRAGIGRNSAVFLVVSVIGLGVIFFFGWRNQPQAASAEEQALEQRVDVALSKLVGQNKSSGSLINNSSLLVDAFDRFSSNKQIELEELLTDPFWMTVEEDKPVVATAIKRGPSPEELQAQRHRQLEQEAGQLKLQSVLTSTKGGSCLINGEIYALNQKVGDSFTVSDILSDHVVLTSGSERFVLQF